MARSKNLHIVNYTVEIEQPNDPSADWATGVIQVDALLSEQLGRTIRNGNAFRLVGMGAQLRGFTGSPDQDVGFSGVTSIQYCPVTRQSAGAHDKMFRQWRKQKQLRSGVGEFVRYDDFEVSWSQTALLPTARRSSIRMTGLDDSSTETIGLFGASTDGAYVSIEDFYNSLNPVDDPSKNPFGNVIKEPKFTEKFPSAVNLEIPSSFSAVADVTSTPDELFGQVATGEMIWLPSDNHISHLTGTLNYFFKGVSADTIGQIADSLKLTITLVYEGWSPLNTKRRSSKKSSMAKGKSMTRSKTSKK